jgi:hypothetical protein
MLTPSLRKKFILGTALLILLVGGALGLLVRYDFIPVLKMRCGNAASLCRYIAEAAGSMIARTDAALTSSSNYRKITTKSNTSISARRYVGNPHLRLNGPPAADR